MIKAFDHNDVFYLYERNKSHYDNCKSAKRICPDEKYNVDCYCHKQNVPVLPIAIGDQCVPCNFKRKVYIRPGEECSICLENILQKNTAYLTACGHSFHKLCLFKIFELKSNHLLNFSCPICRSNLGYPDLYSRYSYIYPKVNNLDILEDFWLAKDFKTIQMCSKGRNHSLGMNKSCRSCLKYRKTGM